MYKSRVTGSSGSGAARHNDKSSGRYNIGTRLIDEDEFKQGKKSQISSVTSC